MRTVIQQRRLLGGCRIQPEPAHMRTLAFAPDRPASCSLVEV
jgi:hypothetical protein